MEQLTIKTDKEVIAEIDAIAAATKRSRNDVVDQALRQFLEANAWQIERIEAGLADAREGRVVAAEEVFAEIAAKHRWER